MEVIKFASIRHDFVPFEEIMPKSAKNYIPDWYKNMSTHLDINEPKTELLRQLNSSTVKRCPSFRDIFKYGIVIPAPSDIYLSSDGNEWRWETPSNCIELEYHDDFQFKNDYPDKSVKGVFKIKYPMAVFTPPGWSVMQIPLIYHANPDWHIAWGILDADEYHDINPQLIYTSENRELVIRQGEPLFYFYPFKRAEWKIEMLEYKEVEKEIAALKWRLNTRFAGRYIKNIRRKK